MAVHMLNEDAAFVWHGLGGIRIVKVVLVRGVDAQEWDPGFIRVGERNRSNAAVRVARVRGVDFTHGLPVKLVKDVGGASFGFGDIGGYAKVSRVANLSCSIDFDPFFAFDLVDAFGLIAEVHAIDGLVKLRATALCDDSVELGTTYVRLDRAVKAAAVKGVWCGHPSVDNLYAVGVLNHVQSLGKHEVEFHADVLGEEAVTEELFGTGAASHAQEAGQGQECREVALVEAFVIEDFLVLFGFNDGCASANHGPFRRLATGGPTAAKIFSRGLTSGHGFFSCIDFYFWSYELVDRADVFYIF